MQVAGQRGALLEVSSKQKDFTRCHQAYSNAPVRQLNRGTGCRQIMDTGFGAVITATQDLQAAIGKTGQQDSLGAQADAGGVFNVIAVGAAYIGDLTAGQIYPAKGENVCDIELLAFLVQRQAGRHSQVPCGQYPGLAVDWIDPGNAVVGHVGYIDTVIGGNGQIVQSSGQGRHGGQLPLLGADAQQLTHFGIDHIEIALTVKVNGRGNLQALGNGLHLTILGIDAHHLALEPERPIEPAIRADLKAIEATHILANQPRRLGTLAVDLPQGIAHKDLAGIERPGVLVKGDGVDPRQAIGKHDYFGVIAGAIKNLPALEPGPGHLALGADGDIISLACVRPDQGRHLAALLVDLIDAVTHHAARQQATLLINRQAVHPFEIGWCDQSCRLSPVGGLDAGGQSGGEKKGGREFAHGSPCCCRVCHQV